MLQLKNITKVYSAAGTDVHALRGVSLSFRESEFVSVLGQSGCGKTTLLNIVGGLDQYTDGDLVINGRSTKDYRDSDWDAYRNHSIGFVFQSYNLIPHQSVIANVELALTLSGVTKAERTARAAAVLEKVGLHDQLDKKPNQLSGGQMQRVAIARALINDPDILLADEPTGALDSETSVQIMELLKEIAADKLVIMVTHNPDLADEYSTRIIRLLDGRVIGDTNPLTEEEELLTSPPKEKKPSMSFLTAVSLSFTNLLTKKARTILTAFAGSIGIIGIAMILALSNGLQSFIDETERDTLSSYPIMIQDEAMNLGDLIQSFSGVGLDTDHPLDRIYTNNFMARMMNTMVSQVTQNDLTSFMAHIEANRSEIDEYTTAISYSYDVPLNLYHTTPDGTLEQVNPSKLFESMGGGMGAQSDSSSIMGGSMMTNSDMWRPLIPNSEFLSEQYEVIAGKMPEAFDEAVLVVMENNEIPDILLYSLGLKNSAEFEEMMLAVMRGETVDAASSSYAYDEIVGLEYPLLLPTDYYVKSGDTWSDQRENQVFMRTLTAESPSVKIVGILRPNPDAAAVSSDVFIGYTHELTQYVINGVNDAEITQEQLANPDIDVFTGVEFESSDEAMFTSMDDVVAYLGTIEDETEYQQTAAGLEQMQAAGMGDEQILAMLNDMIGTVSTDATYDSNVKKLGITDLLTPSAINIYASSFENKDLVADFITDYNSTVDEGSEISYTDYIGLLLSSITTVINAISIILIAFVSISLVVSSIMIGIITHISVLERTREIGVLRSIGASKRDISRVFNAETLIIGLTAGTLGIAVTALLCIPANAIVFRLTDIRNVALLPPLGAVGLIVISMLLTFVAGLFPARTAANKDPVVALRTE